jgi:hypothetical protein
MRIRASLIPNPNHETRKTKIRIWQGQDNNSTRFYYKNEIITKQGCDKKHTKIGVEQIKGSGEFYFYLYPLHIYLKEHFQKYFDLHVAHIHPCASMCTHVWTMNDLNFN